MLTFLTTLGVGEHSIVVVATVTAAGFIVGWSM